jgi:hypothetical protein
MCPPLQAHLLSPAPEKMEQSKNDQILLYVTTTALGLSFPMALHLVLTQSCASPSRPDSPQGHISPVIPEMGD